LKQEKDYLLKSATQKDCKLLYLWRSEKSVRQWSFNKKKFSIEKHKKWFAKNLKNKKILIKIFSYKKNKCGMVRLNLIKKNYNLSYLIDKSYRKKNLGKKMLSIFLNDISRNIKKDSIIYAKSDVKNTASNRCLASVGFKLLNKNKKINKYLYKINENPK
jgi:RimJ/RimL family protein N-acetyltransferase